MNDTQVLYNMKRYLVFAANMADADFWTRRAIFKKVKKGKYSILTTGYMSCKMVEYKGKTYILDYIPRGTGT